MKSLRIVILLTLIASSAAAEVVTKGELVTITTSVDEEHSYVLYLPTNYEPEKKWPVLYCLDARGRGKLVADVFLDAAETYGWILACSNNTASDGPFEPNVVAMRYLWYDTHQRLSIDDARIYATGFSGVSRFLWILPQMNVPVAGVIGVGGGAPWRPIPDIEIEFDYFGIVGDEDFNWAEMNELDGILEERNVTHRLEVFDGPHGWSGREPATDAVRWMELRAVRSGTASADDEKIRQWLSEDLEDLGSLIDEERIAAAADLRDWIRRDYEGLVEEIALPDLDPKHVRAERDRRDKLVREELAWMTKMQEPIGLLLQPGAPGAEQFRAKKQLDIAGWKKKAEGDDPAIARSANRRLATLFGQLSFYLPNMFFERGDPSRAARSLDMAAEIAPDSPRLNYQRARVLIADGKLDAANDELEAMLERLGWPGSALADDENLVKLKGNERFQKLIAVEDDSAATDDDE